MSAPSALLNAGFQPEKLLLNERNLETKRQFSAIYNCEAEFFIRMPGRVNLIGEHVDYSGYGVCPMALQQDIFVAVSTTQEMTLQLQNTNPKFESYSSCISLGDVGINVGKGGPKWYQYVMCGIKGIVEIMPPETRLKGLKVLVSGTIPVSAGLSSSSALVCAAALATAYAHKIEISREDIASLCAKSERYIGTQGGGMDQAIAFLATRGCAKMINFNPLRAEDVRLPDGAVFVIAHSLVELNKAATGDFNCRVVECRLAAQLLAKKNGQDWRQIKTLGQVQSLLDADVATMIELVQKHLHEESYHKDEILRELQVTEDDLLGTSLTPNTRNVQTFKLKQRAMHVYGEVLRVQTFVQQCQQQSPDAMTTLGELMNQSHASLRDLYECSHPELDRLVNLSAKHTLGARLTGAGWGGCVVALLRKENVDNYMEALKRDFYYSKRSDYDSILFATEPQEGARVYTL